MDVSEQISTEPSASEPKDSLSPVAAAAHRSGAVYSADLISISRRVLYAQAVVIAMVAAIFFMAGYVLGPGRTAKTEQPVEKKERFGDAVDVFGTITYSDAARNPIKDPGAVVILIPKGSAPADRLPSDGLRPTDPGLTGDELAPKAIKFLGGVYLRADENGEIDIKVNSGRYYVLVISRAAGRRDDRMITTQDLKAMKKFFAAPQTLIGERRYDWKLRKLDAETLLNISLD